MGAVERWAESLARWGIPEEIVAAAPESPWRYPPELMRRRVEVAEALEPSPSLRRATEALPDAGSVLDVGVGGGAASLPLGGIASIVIGVDTSEDMLAAFREEARARGIRTSELVGRWPDVAPLAPSADVVVCNHVLYNVPDIGPFARALDEHARRRVVIEITSTHPLAWMNDLWLRFHGLERPDGPTATDAEAALSELGFDVRREDEMREPRASGFADRHDAVSLVRRRLCLPPERDAEVAEALGDRIVERNDLWSAGPTGQVVVALWWDTAR
jgi:SAM-dependent methyltransferase